MTLTETTISLPDGRTLDPGQLVRIVGERGVYRVHHLNESGRGLWLYGGTGHGDYRQRQWRCVPLERVGRTVKARNGEKAHAI